MKRLLLLRHGKSDWHADYLSDHDRPLNPRGRAAAKAIGRFLAELDQVPEKLITSSALRAHATVALAKEEGAWPGDLEIRPELYQSSAASVLEMLNREAGDPPSILLAGHEPTWSELASLLLGGAEVKMVTAALARFDLPIERWEELRPGRATLSWLVTPKLLKDSRSGGNTPRL